MARRTAFAMGVGGAILWFATTEGEYEQDGATEPDRAPSGTTHGDRPAPEAGLVTEAGLRARKAVARRHVEAMHR